MQKPGHRVFSRAAFRRHDRNHRGPPDRRAGRGGAPGRTDGGNPSVPRHRRQWRGFCPEDSCDAGCARPAGAGMPGAGTVPGSRAVLRARAGPGRSGTGGGPAGMDRGQAGHPWRGRRSAVVSARAAPDRGGDERRSSLGGERGTLGRGTCRAHRARRRHAAQGPAGGDAGTRPGGKNRPAAAEGQAGECDPHYGRDGVRAVIARHVPHARPPRFRFSQHAAPA